MAKLAEVAKAAEGHSAELKPPAPAEKLNFGAPNVAIVHLEELDTDPETKARLDFHADTFWLDYSRDCLAGRNSDEAEGVKSAFEKLLALRYVVVVRTRVFGEPTVSGESHFSPGFWEGDALLYDIEKGELVGGYSVSARNDETVDVRVDSADSWLRSNLWSNARRAVKEALAPHTEGATPLD